MPHILLTGPIHPDAMQLLTSTPGITVEVAQKPTPEFIDARIGAADAILVRAYPIGKELLAKANQLKLVARHGVGYDEVDVPMLTARGIPLTITPGANMVSVAEHAIMLLLACFRRVIDQHRFTSSGQWNAVRSLSCMEARERTALVIGHGRIGSRVAPVLKALGMRVLVTDPAFKPEQLSALGYEPVADLKQGLAQADAVTIHVPASIPENRGMVNRNFLGAMQRGAYFVNTARGDLVDEAALLEALNTGQIAAAGLDVFRGEPVTDVKSRPLLTHPNVIVTAHTAAFTEASMRKMGLHAAQSCIAAVTGGKLEADWVVNQEVLTGR